MLVVSLVPHLGDTGWCVRGFGGAASLGSGTVCHQGPLHASWGWKREDVVLVTERVERRLRTHARHMCGCSKHLLSTCYVSDIQL